ncbi:HemY domain protein [Oceaniovalibus guishaninsula JLT2003]|uniref:HemY domain protein n=1 Tax=Oceaniovalibus guishaninsula JLT2003 TaxID=1231392 RepID=K2HB65_9RHOB|nr:heme biosynthesis HemY N-terminal domain-containing protein [Oceaniovalibus guishaninsula]EKE44703.1 HemY domain protein [Oceaniovalibus guishaninsula JLT2003]
MLWSLLKIVLFIVAVALLAVLAQWLMAADGALRVSFANMEFTLGPLQATIALLLLLLTGWIVFKLIGLLFAFIRFLNGDDTAISRYFSRNRERKGYQALADGMLALASGEGREAMARADRAEKYLGRPELTNLITAQAAEMIGDRKRAEDVYKRLLADDRTRFVGVRGLLKQKLDQGDTQTALRLAEKAFALKPRHPETQDILLRLQAGQEDWRGARRTLGAKLKYGQLPRDVHKRRDAVLALSEAKDILDEGKSVEARMAAIEANRLSPDLIPAAVMAARGYAENNQQRYAVRVLRKAWEVQPHPDLAAAYADLEPDETPQQRIKRFAKLTRLKPDHPETKMLLAELYIAAEDFPAARRALGDLATTAPTARSVTIMAAIERGEGADDAVVRGWLTRALNVPRGPQWVCDNCHTVHGAWGPICGNCGAFDTLAWTEPQNDTLALPVESGMLPLLVGRVETAPVEVEPLQTRDPVVTPTDGADNMPETVAATRPEPQPAPDLEGDDLPPRDGPDLVMPKDAQTPGADRNGARPPK